MTAQAPIQYTGKRDFTNVYWYSQKSVVSYGLDNQVDLNSAAPTSTVKYPNLGAVDTWTQMQEKPKFMQAWEAINEASELLFTATMLNRFYAYNALYYIFDDYTQVQDYVLYGLSADPDAQQTIY